MSVIPSLTGLSVEVPSEIYVGQKLKPIVKPIPAAATATPFVITTDDASFVYDSSGNLNLTGYSSALSTVTLNIVNGAYSGAVTITANPSVSSMSFDAPNISVAQWYSIDLIDRLSIVTASAEQPGISWTSSKPSVATVDPFGRVDGLAFGVTTITASVTDYRVSKATIIVTVVPPLNNNIVEITTATIYCPFSPLYQGRSVKTYLLIEPSDAKISSLVWSVSTPTTAYIDPSTGVITVINALDPNSSGEVIVNALLTDSLSNVTSTSQAMACSIKLDAIQVSPSCVTSLQIGQTTSLVATTYPSIVSDPTIEWTSSNPSIAYVDGNGTVTGASNGTCTITATSQDIQRTSGSATISVQNGLTSVTSNIPASLVEGATFKAVLTPLKSDSTVGSYSGILWDTSDSTVATVTTAGVITAISSGTCNVTAIVSGQSGSVSFSQSLTVTRAVKNIIVSPTSLFMNVGNSRQLTTVLFPSGAADTSITWLSSAPTIVTVDSSGNVTAIKVGVASIKATANGGTAVVATIPVNVGVPISTLSIVIPSTIFMPGTYQATVKVLPAEAAVDFTLWGSKTSEQTTYSTSEFGQVTGTGLFIPSINVSTGIVTQSGAFNVLTGSQFTSSIISTIAPSITIIQRVTSIIMSQVYYTRALGTTITLSAAVFPTNAYNKTILWSSSNVRVASVAQTGIVTTVAAGTATITARSTDGSNISAITIVTVTA